MKDNDRTNGQTFPTHMQVDIAMAFTSIILATALIAMAIGAIAVVPWADRQRIIRLINQRGGTVVSMERVTPWIRALLAERGTTFWRVRYRAADGACRVADCFASFLRCKVYRDEPEDDGGQKVVDGPPRQAR